MLTEFTDAGALGGVSERPTRCSVLDRSSADGVGLSALWTLLGEVVDCLRMLVRRRVGLVSAPPKDNACASMDSADDATHTSLKSALGLTLPSKPAVHQLEIDQQIMTRTTQIYKISTNYQSENNFQTLEAYYIILYYVILYHIISWHCIALQKHSPETGRISATEVAAALDSTGAAACGTRTAFTPLATPVR